MDLAAARPNVELRVAPSGEPVVIFAFPYSAEIVNAMRAIPGRRFDWVEREWSVPQHETTAVYVADVLARWPELVADEAVHAWLGEAPLRWLGRVTTRKREGAGQFVARTVAGDLPPTLAELSSELGAREAVLPFSAAAAEALLDERGARLDGRAAGCASRLQVGLEPPGAALVVEHTVNEPRFGLDVLWDEDTAQAFVALPGSDARSVTVPIDPWLLEPLEAFLLSHDVAVAPSAEAYLAEVRAEHTEAIEHVRRSRARSAPPPDPPPRLAGGELAPFQWAGVRYVLEARRAFLADEQGLGKTVQALAALEADDAFPAIVVCPASLKLNWERETAKWLPHRSVAVIQGRMPVPPTAEITILNYEVVAAHRETLGRMRPRALVVDESHLCKNPQAKRTQAVRRLAETVVPDGLRLALTGTPVLNHAEELISQLRVIGRLEDFGSGARFARQFRGQLSEERLHWHLRRRCFVRRLKSEVLPQLPAKRQVVVPVALTNEREYRLAEDDVIAWLRTQPLDLRELNAKIAATLRAERLAQLGTLQRLAARGKLRAALAWIGDFLESGEPLVVFARHVEVQDAVLERFPDAAHLLGRDSGARRDE